MPARSIHAALVATLLGPLFCQDGQREVAAAGIALDAEEGLVGMRWGFDAKKGLLVCPNPMTEGPHRDLTPYFADPTSGNVLTQFGRNIGITGFMTVLLFGDADLVSHCFADYHFRRMGLDRTEPGLRARLVVPNQGNTAFERELDDLHRLLAVRIVERRGIKSAVPELRLLAKATKDPLLRWAAQDAVATLTGVPVSADERAARFPTAGETLASVPDRYDLICGIDHERIPYIRELPWLGRRLGLETILQHIRATAGSCSPAQLAGGQVLSDAISLLCFQLGLESGNFRLGRLTVAVHAGRGKSEPDVWARVDGRFDAARVSKLIAANGGRAPADPRAARDRIDLGRFRFRVTDRFVTVHTADYPLAKTGGRAAELKELGFGGAAQIFVHLRQVQRLGMMTGTPLSQVDGALILGRLTHERDFVLEMRCKTPAQASGIVKLVELGRGLVRTQLAPQMARQGLKTDPEKLAGLVFPEVVREDGSPVVTSRWQTSTLSFAEILQMTLGIEGARSTQDGPRER